MGGYFSAYQGFDKDISQAITEQYLPVGLASKVPKIFNCIIDNR